MNCEELRDRLSAHLEADLDARERARIEDHLSECPDCRREYRELRHVVDLLRGLPPVAPPPGLADRVIARLRAGEGQPGLLARCQARIRRFAELPWAIPAAALAAGLAALAIVRGFDVSPEAPEWTELAAAPRVEVASDPRPQPAERAGQPARLVGASAEPAASQVVSPMLACLRAGGPTRRRTGSDDPCEHWDSWMVGLGMRDAPAFAAEMEAVPAPHRAWILGRIGELAIRSGSAPMLAGTLRSAGDPTAAGFASRIERTAHASTR